MYVGREEGRFQIPPTGTSNALTPRVYAKHPSEPPYKPAQRPNLTTSQRQLLAFTLNKAPE